MGHVEIHPHQIVVVRILLVDSACPVLSVSLNTEDGLGIGSGVVITPREMIEVPFHRRVLVAPPWKGEPDDGSR